MRLCLTGCDPMTGNLGVSALCYSVIRALFEEMPSLDLSVTDHGWGMRRETIGIDSGTVSYRRVGIRLSRRYWRPESLWNIRVSSWLGGLRNPAARAICDADAVLDISGGDSFTDLYGEKRFAAMSLIKLIALGAGCPLVLLPQTYGPYRNPANRQTAERIVRDAAMAWARDEESFQTLKDLASVDFDPARHRCGVDVAFGLESLRPENSSFKLNNHAPRIGFNISGLIHNGGETVAARHGLKVDYRQLVIRLLKKLLEKTDASIALVPHVVTPPGHYESDVGACEDVIRTLGTSARGRIEMLAPPSDPRQAKWVISQFDWFCGTRMHSTIAGLSSRVPTVALAYSLKARGVFASCGIAENVVDMRDCSTEEALDRLWEAWLRREQTRAALSASVPGVIAKAKQQIRDIVWAIRSASEAPPAQIVQAAV